MNNTMNNKPKTIPFMWIAFYNDGSCLPQFDLETGKNFLFKEINQSKLIKFGWYPIPFKLSEILGGNYYHNPKLTPIVLELQPNQRLIALREESQSFFNYTHCLKCGFNFQWMPNKEDGIIGDSGLPCYGSSKVSYSEVQPNGKLAFEVICPKCGVRNDLKCPKCDKWWNKTQDDASKGQSQDKWTYHLECPDCKGLYEQRTISTGAYIIKCKWLLGYQETLKDGSNSKCIMSIDKNGTIQLSNK